MAADERVTCCPKRLIRKNRDRDKSTCFIVLSILLFLSACDGQAFTRSPPQPSATLAAIALSIKSRPIQDSRCYLMNGGAVESFFISEDTPVGSVIGTLSVNGDPREEDGNISLRVQEKGAAIGLAPGTKNVTLLRPLDREEKNGPSNVYVNVRCDRRRTTDPSFIIPVSVRVWDVNDNPPVWERNEYRVKVSELAAVGTRLVNVKADDKDQPGPHNTIRYYVLPGPYSEHFGFANELDSVLVLKKPLDYETIHNVTVKLRAEDSGSPPLHADATLYVQVMDADDHNPKFTYDRYMATLPEDAVEGAELQVTPGPLSAQDQDKGINAPIYYTIQDDRHTLFLHNDTGVVRTTAALLRASLPITFVIKATQYDNPDRYALSTLTINRLKPPSGIKFLSRVYSGAVREDTPTGSVILKLHTDRDADNPSLQFYVSDRSFLDKFAINSAGEVILRRPLDYEETDQYHYQVMVTDGNSNDTATLNMSVVNVNEWEPRFRHLQYEFKVTNVGEAGGLVDVGKVEVYDGDKGDHVTLGLQGPDANLFYINDMGEIYMKEEALSALNTSVVHVTATAQDSGVPIKQSTVPVLVHVPSSRPVESSRVSASGTVVAVFGVALLTLAGLVLGLISYIYRYKRAKTSPSNSPSPNEKMSAPVDVEGRSGSLLSVSAGASTILASTSSLQIPDAVNETPAGRGYRPKSKIAPLPPSLAPPAPAPSAMSDHLGGAGGVGGAGGRSGVAWPSATIPARVKKLSWDDNDRNKGSSGESNLDIHEASNPALTDHMNLTVYF